MSEKWICNYCDGDFEDYHPCIVEVVDGAVPKNCPLHIRPEESDVAKWERIPKNKEPAKLEAQLEEKARPTKQSQSASQIADSIEAACFPGQGQYIDPKASWVLNWYQQLRAL